MDDSPSSFGCPISLYNVQSVKWTSQVLWGRPVILDPPKRFCSKYMTSLRPSLFLKAKLEQIFFVTTFGKIPEAMQNPGPTFLDTKPHCSTKPKNMFCLGLLIIPKYYHHTVFKNSQKYRISVFQFWPFYTNFFLTEIDLVRPQASGFEWDFLCDFKTPCFLIKMHGPTLILHQ